MYWFNENAIGIELAGDFTKYSMPKAQFDALVSLVKQLMAQYGLTLDNVYPHQIVLDARIARFQLWPGIGPMMNLKRQY